jgi:2-polyprenyl-3-methyl-5-hydroxy-6-metoxy-1,4-benzoquinol methylase
MQAESKDELIWTPEMVRRFWDFERTHPERYFSFQVGAVIARRFRRYLSGRVVDYGAGPGFLLDELLRRGVQCAAVEFGAETVAQLNNRFKERKGFLGARDHAHLAEWRQTFDAAFLIEVVEHLYDEQLHECLSDLASLLKPGGCLIVTTPNEEDRSKSFLCSPESGKLFHRFQHVRSWTAESLRRVLGEHGFDIAVMQATDFTADVAANRNSMLLPLRLLRGVAQKLRRQKPNLYAVAVLREQKLAATELRSGSSGSSLDQKSAAIR